MFIKDVIVKSNQKIAENTFLLEVLDEEFIPYLKPGQFFNIQVSQNAYPLLRRPFSICNIENDSLFFMYKVVGEGTDLLSRKINGEKINVLGPLGNSFNFKGEIDHAIIIGGGIGIAPFPFLLKKISNNIDYSVLFGVRSKSEIHSYGMENIFYSSDDGSVGLKGNVIDLLDYKLEEIKNKNIKIYACGPNPMLKALQNYTINKNLECEVSMESAMACGFGICQGCPIETVNSTSYKLICKDGPVFKINDIVF